MGFFRKKNGRKRNGDKIIVDSVSKQFGSIEFVSIRRKCKNMRDKKQFSIKTIFSLGVDNRRDRI